MAGMMTLVRNGFHGRPGPERLPRSAVEAKYQELMQGRRRSGRHPRIAEDGGPRGPSRGNPAGIDRRQNEDPVAPDHRRCGASARNRYLPADVLRLAPLDGGRSLRRGAVAARAAPLGPVVQGILVRPGRRRERKPDRQAQQGLHAHLRIFERTPESTESRWRTKSSLTAVGPRSPKPRRAPTRGSSRPPVRAGPGRGSPRRPFALPSSPCFQVHLHLPETRL